MNFLNDINGITVLFAAIFLIPMAAGIWNPSPAGRIQHSFRSLLNNIELIAGIILTLYFYKLIFVEKSSRFLSYIYQFVPPLEEVIPRYEESFPFSVFVLLFSLFASLMAIHLVTGPFYRHAIIPMTTGAVAYVDSLKGAPKRIIGGAWQLPKSIWLVLLFSLLLNFYTYYDAGTPAAKYISRSAAYTAVNEKILHPIIGSDTVRKLPVLIHDSFQEINGKLYADNNGGETKGEGGNVPVDSVFPIIEYFNGVTLDEAVKSTDEIDQAALEIIGTEQDDKEKAHLIYRWISRNIAYDREKAKALYADPSTLESGAQIAFAEKKGICFDYSALYVSMCRAAGLKVRLVTGLGYNGASWGDHAWNQVYYPEEDRWINVDTTFGSTGHDSFDSFDFSWIHKGDDVQGEW